MREKNDAANFCNNCSEEMVKAWFETPEGDWVMAWLCGCQKQMQQVTVRITKAQKPAYWYAGLEGETFIVYKDRKDYILKEDYDRGHKAAWHHIAFEDCEEVQDED